MPKVSLIAKMRKRSKTLFGDYFATVSLAITKGRFRGGGEVLYDPSKLSSQELHIYQNQRKGNSPQV